MDLAQVIKRPIITEKSAFLMEKGKYTFQVARQATKKEVKQAVERFLGKVKVKSVKTAMMQKRRKRVGRLRKRGKKIIWKKALVQLAEGNKIDLLPEASTKKKVVKK